MKSLVIGSRGSSLALAQSRLVRDRLSGLSPDLKISIKVIRTTGDRFLDTSPRELAALTKGIFVKEIEEALLEGDIDLAVHSFKDIPVDIHPGLKVAAVPIREDPRDVLVSRHPLESALDLPEEARVATSSPRRAEQLKRLRPDLRILPLRGNVDTRIGKLDQLELDAVVLAAAGMNRLGFSARITCYLDPELVVPAPGQGCLALETRENPDSRLDLLMSEINHPESRMAAAAERRFQLMSGAGCDFPLGAFARVEEGIARFSYFIGFPERGIHCSGTLSGYREEIDSLADQAIEEINSGAREEDP